MAASVTIIIWGITFISTKVLLNEFSPIELLFYRFVFAYIVLFLISPKPIPVRKRKSELLYMAAGLCGVTIYFTFQNVGLIYTLASNAGVIIAVAPMFTAIISYFMVSKTSLHKNFIIGFFITMMGVTIISFNGNFVFKLNPLGDFLMIMGAVSWGFYCNILVIAEDGGLSLIQRTRKVFFYGIIFIIPILFFTDFHLEIYRFLNLKLMANLMFLSVAASAICFLLWNFAVETLGPVKTATYIYFTPIVTIIASIIILKEPFTLISLSGTILIILGLIYSERKNKPDFIDENSVSTINPAHNENCNG